MSFFFNKKEKVRSHTSFTMAHLSCHQENYKLYLFFLPSMPLLFYFQVIDIKTFYFCFRCSLVFDLLSLQNWYWSFNTVSDSSSTQTLPDLKLLPTHLFHHLQMMPFCHMQNCTDSTHMERVSPPSLPSQHRSCSFINFYWPETSTTHKQHMTKKSSVWLLWACFMENRRQLDE